MAGKQETFVCYLCAHTLLLMAVLLIRSLLPKFCISATKKHDLNSNAWSSKTTLSHDQGSNPTMFMPACYKTTLIRNRPAAHTLVVPHTYSASTGVLSSSHTNAFSPFSWRSKRLPPCVGWVTAAGSSPFHSWGHFKCPSQIQGQSKESTSWVNSARDRRRGLWGC